MLIELGGTEKANTMLIGCVWDRESNRRGWVGVGGGVRGGGKFKRGADQRGKTNARDHVFHIGAVPAQ